MQFLFSFDQDIRVDETLMQTLAFQLSFKLSYTFQHGSEYNSAVPRKLSESFGIDISGASAVTSKQVLLTIPIPLTFSTL